MGSLLEGMLLAVRQADPAKANQAAAAPKNPEGKVKPFWDWSLPEMINVAHEVGWIGLDVKKPSHSLREFRNLIQTTQGSAFGDGIGAAYGSDLRDSVLSPFV